MTQLDLILKARARRTDRRSSHEAAKRVNGPTLAAMVLADLRENGPATSHEIAQRMRLELVTVSPRMRPLERAKKVRECGKRDGRTVWEFTPAGERGGAA